MRKHLIRTDLGRIKRALGFLIVVCLATLGLAIHNAWRLASLVQPIGH